MKRINTTLLAVLLGALLCSPGLFAQAEQTPERIPGAEDLAAQDAEEAEGAGSEETTAEGVASNEVDYNEDNFRRSMELKDQMLQRSPDLTTGSYSTGTGLKALDDLPEASQKHLREELREVIVENGPWTPEDAGEIYPYEPSAEAKRNGTLAKREQAAWGELVARYHEREAEIHANAPRIQAAGDQGSNSQTANTQASNNPAGSSQPGSTQGQGENGSEQEQSSEDAARAERAAALAAMLESSDSTDGQAANGAPPAAEQGVSQNALELLMQRQQVPATTATATAQISVSTPEDSESTQTRSTEPELDLSSEDVIAIDDLRKVRLEPEDSEEAEKD